MLELYPDFNELIACKERKSNLTLASLRSVKSTVPGNHHSPFRGQGLEFDAVRHYVAGDDIRSIDWRVTARTGVPQVKLFKEERKRTVVLTVDMNESMRFGTKNTFKSVQAARIAAFLGWHGLAKHDNISACLFGDVPSGLQFFTPTKTRTSFCRVLRMLSEPVSAQNNVSLSESLQHLAQATHTGSLVYVISDFMDLEKLQDEAPLSRLSKKCDIVFIAINDPADKTLYPVGTIGFSAKEKIYANTESLSGREAYTELYNANRERLYRLSSKFKIPLIELTTESDIRKDLVLGLKMIARRKRR